MTAPSKMGRKHKLNYISNGVGRWLAAAERICGYITTIGYYHISVNYFGRSKPLPYHVIFLETKNYCGITKSYKINLTTHFFSLFTLHFSLFTQQKSTLKECFSLLI